MISTQVAHTLEQIRPLLDPRIAADLRQRWNSLVMPPGSLGRLEDIVVHYGLIRGSALPSMQRKGLYLFCADHGVAAEGVSPWSQDVTRQMVHTYLRGGAVINALCRQFGIELLVVDVGVRGQAETGVLNCKIAQGTANFLHREAMSEQETNLALETGITLAREASTRFDAAAIGEMGIANTTSASAIMSAITGRDALETVGRGSGATDDIRHRKVLAVRGAMHLHKEKLIAPFGVLQCLGGFEIAAMTGFLLGAAAVRLPVIVDGFIAGAAALMARAIKPDSLDVAIFSHRSAEEAHGFLLSFMGVEPQLDLAMCLGEGSGAALVLNLLEAALRVYRETNTLDEARITSS
jgi:nicotinate-nucleotide--dimethylbenzimidazole phosphoribosyltransferase